MNSLQCFVPNCENTTGVPFPKQDDLKQKWLDALKVDNAIPTESSFVCLDHFADADLVEGAQVLREPSNGDKMAAPASPVSESASVNKINLEKIEHFLNDPAYKELIENSANYNTRICIERRLRLPFIDTQTGIAQNPSTLFMHRRQRLPGLLPGQIYSYPRRRWRKKRRQYLSVNTRTVARAVDSSIIDTEVDMHSISQIENPALQDTDSKDSQLLLKDEISKEWFYDEQDMLEMDLYDEPDPDSDLDFEDTYTKRSKRRKNAGRGRGGTDSPGTPGRRRQAGRGRKKAGPSFEPASGDPDKPFACDLCGARYKTRPGLTYHYRHSHKEGASDENSRDSNASLLSVPAGIGVAPSPSSVPPVGVSGEKPVVETPGDASPTLPPGPNQGQVYQDSYVSFLNKTPGAASRSGTQPIIPPVPQVQQPGQPQIPPALPPNMPTQPVHHVEDPTMPVLVPEKSLDGMPPTQQTNNVVKDKAVPNPYCDFCLGDSRENKKTSGSEELVSCSDCGRSGHPTCLQFTANMSISVKKYRWQCIECKCCSVCGNSDNDDQLLFCDDCDRGYHMYCLSPPLVNPPEGSWSCKLCIEEFHKK